MVNKTVSQQDNGIACNDKELHKCQVCDEGFRTKNQLRTHCLIHKLHACKLCNKRFRRPCEVRKHEKRHERPYICNVCDRGFGEKQTLVKHILVHSEGNHVCEICNASFALRSVLRKHMAEHMAFRCYKCSKRFETKEQCDSHLLKHSTEKGKGRTTMCDVCHKIFTKPYELKRHYRIHTGDRPYKCLICGLRFAQRGNLKSHQESHAEEKKYECEICGKKFARKYYVVQHQIIHSEEKRYACDVCNRKFTDKSSCRRHRKEMHPEMNSVLYECSYCDQRYGSKRYLKAHLLSHSPDAELDEEQVANMAVYVYKLN